MAAAEGSPEMWTRVYYVTYAGICYGIGNHLKGPAQRICPESFGRVSIRQLRASESLAVTQGHTEKQLSSRTWSQQSERRRNNRQKEIETNLEF